MGRPAAKHERPTHPNQKGNPIMTVLVTLAADPIELVICGTCDTAAFADEADALGYTGCPDTGEWVCEDCLYAPDSPRLVGMVPC